MMYEGEPRASIQPAQSYELTRRQFLRGTLALGVVLGAEACGVTQTTKDILIGDIEDAVTDVPLKALLRSRIIDPYFHQSESFDRDFGIMKVHVDGVSVQIQESPDAHITGTFSLRTSKGKPLAGGYPLSARSARIPLLGVMTERENANFAQKINGVPYVTITFDTAHPVYPMIAPEIQEYRANQSLRSRDPGFYRLADQWVSVKEACSFLYEDMQLEYLSRAMQSIGEDPMIAVRMGDRVVQVPMMPQILSEFNRLGGRMVAKGDLAGYFLAVKAFANNQPMIDALLRDNNYKEAVPSILNWPMGASPREIWDAAGAWVSEIGFYSKLPFVGDVKKLPYLQQSSRGFFV